MKKLLLIPLVFLSLILLINSSALIGDISDAIIGELNYDGTQALFPDIITSNENVTIITFTGTANDGFVITINISRTNGSIFNVIDTFEWDTSDGLESRIIHMNNITYAIVSQGSQGDGFIDTVNISDTGVITQAVVDSLEFDALAGIRPDIIQVDKDTVAIAYTGVGSNGFLVTVDIDSGGQIAGAVTDSLEFDITNGQEINIIKIASEVYALAYRGVIATNGGKISTINITNDGQIGATTINDFIFDEDALDPEIIQIGTTNTFAVAYENSTGNGNIRTVDIFPNGTIIGELDRAEFDSSGVGVNLQRVEDNVVAVVYSGVDSDGFIKTFNISDGGIISSEIDVLEFEITDATNPRITKVSGNIYQVAFEDATQLGRTVSFNITSIVPELLNLTNLDVFLSKNPVEILESFTLFANYTNATDSTPVLNATCFANSSRVGGGQAGFGRGVLGIGGLSTLNNAVHTQVNNIFGNNTLRVDADNIPVGKDSYAINFRFHAHNQTPTDNLRVLVTCHPDNLTFSNFTFIGQVNTTEAVISTSVGNDTIWGFKNIVLFGQTISSPNCSVVFESINTSLDKHWIIADTTTDLNLNNSFTSTDFGETYVLRPNANERSPFVDAGFGLDVPNETTMTFNSTSNLYFLPNIRHGRPFDFIDRVFCSADNFQNATDFVITNVQDNVAPIVQIVSIDPSIAVINVSNVTIEWIVNDPELLTNFINVSFPNGSLVIQSENKPLILTPSELTALGNYTVVAFANDTGGLSSTANGTFEVAVVDITPPVITLIAPDNNTVNNSIPLNITFTVNDNFPNDIICTLQNSTTIFDTGTFTQAITSTIVLAEGEISLSQNFPNLELTCFDNSVPFNNSATLLLNYTLDTVPPIIFPISPANRTRFNKDIVNTINIKANCTDVPVFRFNMTISNTTDTIASFESRTSINNFIVIDESLNIEDIGVGNYTIDYICSDPHTKKDIPNYLVSKNPSQDKIKWVTPSDNEYELKYIDEGIHILNYGSSKHEDNDRYYFWYILNESEGTKRTFTFELENRKFSVDYLPNSPFKAHFIMQNNWLDFEFGDNDADYFVVLNENNNYEISITTTKTTLNFSSTGELNIATLQTEFEIFFVEQIEDLFKVTECRTDTGSVILLAIFFFISFFFIYIGLTHNIGFIGFFGAILMMILSWFIVACIGIFAIIIALLSFVLIIFFVLRGIGFDNRTYKP